MDTAAFIFDMDGTLIDNMEYHYRAWKKIVRELHGSLEGEALREQLYGKNEEVLGRIFGQDAFNKEQLKEISARKEVYYRELYQPHMKPIAGLQIFLDAAFKRNIQMALGTASNLPNINLMLDTLNIRSYFKAIVSADDVTKSKPDPETFLLAAKKLSVEPGECIVFEDVPKGVEAAANAGMKAVVLTTQHPANDFRNFSNVVRVIGDFTEVGVEELIAV